MNPAEIIVRKRDGEELSAEDIEAFISRYADGSLPDYQMAALAMAVCLRGMNPAETGALTRAMLHSGARLRRLGDRPPRVDKHSTGGLGDKISLILAPLLACAGVHVPMISGRGLGFSGGTLDKLEAIPGFRVQLGEEESEAVLREVGCFIIAASEKLAPADRKLYALRDVTGTVESVPLITASILSKKLAANLDALVIDVKVGSAAFMKTLPDARRLAQSIQQTSVALGTPCRAMITEMYQPLGRAVGNALEVNEAIEVLKGEGCHDSVRELTLRLGAEALVACGLQSDLATATSLLASFLNDGSAYARFVRLVEAQGGHWKDRPLPVAPELMVTAPRAGYLSGLDGFALGTAVIELGGGRRVMTDQVDPQVGLSMQVRIGDRVEVGQPLCKIHADRQKGNAVRAKVSRAFTLVEHPVDRLPLIYD